MKGVFLHVYTHFSLNPPPLQHILLLFSLLIPFLIHRLHPLLSPLLPSSPKNCQMSASSKHPKTSLFFLLNATSPSTSKSPFSCPLCSRGFLDSSSLHKHVRVVHFKIKQYPCKECDQWFGEKSNRRKHVLGKHRKERKFSCQYCSKLFMFKDGLKRHVDNVHLGLRPYHCVECGKRYKQNAHLAKHLQAGCRKRGNRNIQKDSKDEEKENMLQLIEKKADRNLFKCNNIH